MPPPVNLVKKICILGDHSVGKTSTLHRFIDGDFREFYRPTIGTEVTKKNMRMDFEPKRKQSINLNLLIFDMTGHLEFEKVIKTYFHGAEGGLILADLTREETIESIPRWHSTFREVVGDVPVIFAGNKTDHDRVVEKNVSRIKDISAERNCNTMFLSAKRGENVKECFTELARDIIRSNPI